MTLNKRAFLKSLAALFGAGSSRGLLAQPAETEAAQEAGTNWAGNLRYSASSLNELDSAERIGKFVNQHRSLKALGSRHCFSAIADNREQLVSLRDMNRVLQVDGDKRTVTVEAGITYGKLGPELHERGYALHNLASLPHITVAGACATATHGSGTTNGNLATAVSAVELVAADGQIHAISHQEDAERLQGTVVHMGALGIITQLTLKIQPTFYVREYNYRNLAFDQVYDNFDAIMASGYSVSLFTRWENASIRLKVRDDSDFEGPNTLFGATLVNPQPHRGPWHERLPHFRMDSLPPRGNELQSEYFVSLDNAAEAIRAVAQLREPIRPLLRASEIRTVAADDLWMSTCYQRPSIAIHFTWKRDWPNVGKVLPLIEAALSPFDPRPHWGKLHSMSGKAVRSCYPRLDEFKQLVHSFDPQGKFRNKFLGDILFS